MRALFVLYVVGKYSIKLLMSRDKRPTLLRRMFEELGGAFTKFGQMMAMRPDLVPVELTVELLKLLDRVEPFDGNTAMRIVAKELGYPIEKIFKTFDASPVASASIGQVHRAELLTGEKVAVKIQRPEIDKVIKSDLRILQNISHVSDALTLTGNILLYPIFEEFSDWIDEELDYLTEGRNAQLLAESLACLPYVVIPRVYWDYSTRKVLTTEFLQGLWLTELIEAIGRKDESFLNQCKENRIDLHESARNLLSATFYQLYVKRIFHGDPHAANVIFLKDNRIGYVDFGNIGRLSESFVDRERRFLWHISKSNIDYAFDLFLEIVDEPIGFDSRELEKEIKSNFWNWIRSTYGKSDIEVRSIGNLTIRNFQAVRRYGLTIDAQYMKYVKSLSLIDIIICQIDPSVHVREEIQEFLGRYSQEYLSTRLLSYLERTIYGGEGVGILDFLDKLPRRIESVADIISVTGRESYNEISAFRSNLSRFLKIMSIIGIISIGSILGALIFSPELTYLLEQFSVNTGISIQIFAVLVMISSGILFLLSRFIGVRKVVRRVKYRRSFIKSEDE